MKFFQTLSKSLFAIASYRGFAHNVCMCRKITETSGQKGHYKIETLNEKYRSNILMFFYSRPKSEDRQRKP